MADNMYTGTAGQILQHFSPPLNAVVLAKLLSESTPKVPGIYTVDVTSGESSVSYSQNTVDVGIVQNSSVDATNIDAAAANASGGYDDLGQYASYVSLDPVVLGGTNSSFIELQGAGTVDGAGMSTFVLDASHDTSDVVAYAGSGKSFIIGSQGSDTLFGSTSADAKAVLVAGHDTVNGHGTTYLYGGEGADTLIGAGNSTIVGGTGSGQQLLDFTSGSHDSIAAGVGGQQVLSVAHGSNVLNDTYGNHDTLYAGDGSDTLIGSTSGSTMMLYQGNTTVDSSGNDTIGIAEGAHGDTINAGGSSDALVTFTGYSADQVSSLITAAQKADTGSSDPTVYGKDQNVTIHFNDLTAGSTQTATLNNVSHIHFGNG